MILCEIYAQKRSIPAPFFEWVFQKQDVEWVNKVLTIIVNKNKGGMDVQCGSNQSAKQTIEQEKGWG